jgi:hypothetical protein
LARFRTLGRLFTPVLTACLFAPVVLSQNPHEQATARYLDSVRKQPPLLLAFLRQMPKGGDLHNHLAGAIYAESFVDFAAKDGMCIDRTTSVLIAPPCDTSCDKFRSKPPISCAYGDHVLYNSIIDAWSMRNWTPGEESGHDHFFTTFDKFAPSMVNHMGESFAEAASRAADDNLQYLELMHTADGMQAAQLGARVIGDTAITDANFAALRDRLLSGGMSDVVAATRGQLDRDENTMHTALGCGTAKASSGCGVTVRFLYQVLRGLPPASVFAQILLGYELASSDPRFVGLNLVMPEDWYVPMHDFDLHMRILGYMHTAYPKVHLTLHAGELALGMVPPQGLRYHIRESVEVAHAERIGHGVSVMQEDDAVGLLKELAQKNVLVEISLTSNEMILGVKDQDHPLPVYQRYGVPVSLCTDDQGVARSNMTREWVRAVENYHYSYAELKRMARASLEHSFLPGASLWQGKDSRKVAACAADDPGSDKLSASCENFLENNARANTQWGLERDYARFEKKF